MDGSEDVHVPPVTEEESGTVKPTQTLLDPVIVPAVGVVLIVTTAVLWHPAVEVYVTVAVPVDIPDTTPDVLPTVNTEVFDEVQVPPVGVDVMDVVVPTHAIKVPDIDVGVMYPWAPIVLANPKPQIFASIVFVRATFLLFKPR